MIDGGVAAVQPSSSKASPQAVADNNQRITAETVLMQYELLSNRAPCIL
jgi:hypothetical protein